MWRSLLFVPVLNERLVAGAVNRGADAVVLDLEAAVPQDRKQEARAKLPAVIAKLKAAGAEVAVRVNTLCTVGVDDIAVALRAGADLIALPQATIRSTRQAADLAGATPLIPLIESPRGVMDALDIAETASNIAGLGLGVEDYSLAMGAPPTQELLVPAAFQVIQAARAVGCEPLIISDTIADYGDLPRFEAAARKAKALGAAGSFAIHPAQVGILNKVFTPSEEERQEAQEIIALAEKAAQTGSALAARNGTMIDAPIVERARKVLVLWQRFADPSSPAKSLKART